MRAAKCRWDSPSTAIPVCQTSVLLECTSELLREPPTELRAQQRAMLVNTTSLRSLGRVVPPRHVNSLIPHETQVRKASYRYVHHHGGLVTHRCIEALAELGVPVEDLTYDTKSVLLAPGWCPSIPGWHCDFISRDRFQNMRPQPGVDGMVKNYLVVSGGPPTEFLEDRNVTLHCEPNRDGISSCIDSMRQQGEVAVTTNEPWEIVEFSANEVHRPSLADHECGMEWRYLFRATLFPQGHSQHGRFANCMRQQAQVYVDMNAVGW